MAALCFRTNGSELASKSNNPVNLVQYKLNDYFYARHLAVVLVCFSSKKNPQLIFKAERDMWFLQTFHIPVKFIIFICSVVSSFCLAFWFSIPPALFLLINDLSVNDRLFFFFIFTNILSPSTANTWLVIQHCQAYMCCRILCQRSRWLKCISSKWHIAEAMFSFSPLLRISININDLSWSPCSLFFVTSTFVLTLLLYSSNTYKRLNSNTYTYTAALCFHSLSTLCSCCLRVCIVLYSAKFRQ